MPTPAQQDKFGEFQKRPQRFDGIKVLKNVISHSELSSADRGTTWGVTVCPDRDTLIRLNVGNVSQFSIQRGISKTIDPTGNIFFVVLAVHRGALGIRGVPRGLQERTGFTKHVDESIIIFGPMDRWSERIFERPRVVRAMRKHVQVALRTLPDTNWHNPLVDSLI